MTVDVPLRDEVRNQLEVEVVRSGESLEQLLVRGDIDAMIEASSLSPEARKAAGMHRLLGEDTRQLEVGLLRAHRLLPDHCTPSPCGGT